MPIRFLDMFAGIGGFRSGLERLGGFECVGYCEIDKYAKQAYDAMYPTKGELYFADARTVDPYTLPDIDLICGGFPCQSFSIAGLRRGFQDDTRGTLFFEIARIAAVKRPPFLLLENVPGLLSHDKGRTFATILGALDELGYDVAWQILNSKDFGVPQSRKRVYIVGYLRERCAGEILSFTDANAASLISVFQNGSLTNILFPFEDGVQIDMGKLAMWRLCSHEQFGGTWLSDYVPNRLGGFITEYEPDKTKPDCRLIGEDGNIFNLMGLAARTLRHNGLAEQATEMTDRIHECGSYDEALCIIGEYVNITGGEESEDEDEGMGMRL